MQALVIEPLCVFGAAEYSDRFASYLAALARLQAITSVAPLALFGGAALVCMWIPQWQWAANAAGGLAIASPFLLGFTLARSATYVTLTPGDAVRAAAVYCAVALGSLGALMKFGGLTAGSAFLVMGFASAAATFWLSSRLKPEWSSYKEWPLRQVAAKHWSFGRWELAKIGSDWLRENISYVFAGALLGIAEVGTLKALTTLFLPLNQTLTALRRLFLPHLARRFRHHGDDATRDSLRLLSILYAAGTLIYGVAVILAAPRLVPMLYGGKFPELVGLVPWFAGLLAVAVPVHVVDMGLRAVRLPKAIFISSVLAAVTQLFAPWPLTRWFGLRGLIVGNSVGGLVLLLTMTWSLRKKSPGAIARDAQGADSLC